MNLSAKHQQQNLVKGNFTGGLNTNTVPEMIGENQLATCVNMGFNRSTGALETVSGTARIYKAGTSINIDWLVYDKINNVYLFADMTTKSIYKTHLVDTDGDMTDTVKIGKLSGSNYPISAMWESGVLIASGGILQYWNGVSLENIATENAPRICNGVFIKQGRVWVWYKYTLQCSAIGDETDWDVESADDSSSQWLDVGYKEGENEASYILGVSSLSSDTVIIKNDGKIYRLVGDYPNWELKEIARNVNCLNALSYCAVQDGVFVLGHSALFFLQTTSNYGDVLPTNVATNVINLFRQLSVDDTKLKYLPTLNQLWIICPEGKVIVYDLNFKAFTMRQFSEITDVCVANNDILLAKKNKSVAVLIDGVYQDDAFSDDATDIKWEFKARTETSFNDFLLKRCRITYVPLMDNFTTSKLYVGDKRIGIDLPPRKDPRKTKLIMKDTTKIMENDTPIVPAITEFNTARMVFRDRSLEVFGKGEGSAVSIIKIELAVTEV